MKQLFASAVTCVLMASAIPAAAASPTLVDPLRDFGLVSGSGRHFSFAKGVPQVFAFTVPAGVATADIVFSDNPITNGRTSRVTLITWKEGGTPKTTLVNYSRVRSTSIPVTPGRYYFSVNASPEIGFAVMMRYRKIVVAPTTTAPPRGR